MTIPYTLTAVTAAALFIQATPPLADVSGPIERLSLQGAQGVAIYFLCRALKKKDEAKDAAVEAKDLALAKKDTEFTALAIKAVETMALVIKAVEENRKATEDSRKSTEENGSAIDDLASNIAVLTSSIGEREAERAERQDAIRRTGK